MIPFRKSIGFRLLVVSFILLAIPLLLDAFVVVQTRYRHAIADAKNYLVEVSYMREIPLAQIRPINAPLLEILTRFLKLETDFPEKPNKALNEELAKLAQVGDFYGIFLLKITPDNQYIVVASGKEQFIGKDYTEFFKLDNLFSPEALERGYTTYISYDSKTLQPFFIMAHVIYSFKEQRPIGILVVSDSISTKLQELLQPDTHRYPVNFALLLPSTIVFAASDHDLRFNYFLPLKPEYKKAFLEEEPSAIELLAKNPLPVKEDIGYPFFEFTWKGEDQIGYIKKLEGENYALLAYASRKKIFQAPIFTFLSSYGIYGAILIVGGGIAYFMTRRMAKPIRSLSSVMQGIQQGDLSLRYKKDSLGFEINTLGNAFNEMVDAVLEQKQIAEEERVKRETLARELKLGQQVQLSLLPQKMPFYPGVDLAQTYIPAIEVGGDFFDVFVKKNRENQQLVLAIADASGKGVHACFYSLSLRTILRTVAKEYEDIAQVMKEANNLFLCDTAETGMFVTVLMGFYDYKTHTLSYYSCGHNPGLIRRSDGTVEILSHPGIAMGVVSSEESHAISVKLNKGDTLVFYTDGITEAHDEEYRFYGEERLIECLKQKRYESASDVVDEIVTSVNAFVGKAPQHDDITLLVMNITE